MAKLQKALLEFFITEKEVFTFIVRPKVPELNIDDSTPIVLKHPIASAEIEAVVNELKQHYQQINEYSEGSSSLQALANFIDQELDLSAFYELGEKLFTKDLMEALSDFDAIYIVPFGSLHYLPLHAMKYQGKYLIDWFKIAYLPSASVLQYIQQDRPPKFTKRVLLCGVDSTGDMRHFGWETDQIAQLEVWKDYQISYLKNEESTKTKFLEHCADCAVIHISSHGHFAQHDPLDSGAVLYGNYSLRYRKGEGFEKEDYDFLLTVKDIFEKIKLHTDLFVMSGCVTGDSEYKSGDELIGLTRAIMYAGAKSMIVTLFPTIKNVTSLPSQPALQFARFYDFWMGQKEYKVTAMQKFIQSIKSQSPFHAPHFWMPYLLVGNME
ncbi:MAG: CHAT domain-containing protein [Bacteroidota bacterium]